MLRGDSVRLDILIFFQNKCLYILEHTVGFDINFQNDVSRKDQKYKDLIQTLRLQYVDAKFINTCLSIRRKPQNHRSEDNYYNYSPWWIISIRGCRSPCRALNSFSWDLQNALLSWQVQKKSMIGCLNKRTSHLIDVCAEFWYQFTSSEIVGQNHGALRERAFESRVISKKFRCRTSKCIWRWNFVTTSLSRRIKVFTFIILWKCELNFLMTTKYQDWNTSCWKCEAKPLWQIYLRISIHCLNTHNFSATAWLFATTNEQIRFC